MSFTFCTAEVFTGRHRVQMSHWSASTCKCSATPNEKNKKKTECARPLSRKSTDLENKMCEQLKVFCQRKEAKSLKVHENLLNLLHEKSSNNVLISMLKGKKSSQSVFFPFVWLNWGGHGFFIVRVFCEEDWKSKVHRHFLQSPANWQIWFPGGGRKVFLDWFDVICSPFCCFSVWGRVRSGHTARCSGGAPALVAADVVRPPAAGRFSLSLHIQPFLISWH